MITYLQLFRIRIPLLYCVAKVLVKGGAEHARGSKGKSEFSRFAKAKECQQRIG